MAWGWRLGKDLLTRGSGEMCWQMGCAHAHPPKVLSVGDPRIKPMTLCPYSLLAPRTLQVPGEQTKHCPAQGPPIRWNKPRSFL